MTDEENINNPYLDIVDKAILGKGHETQITVTDVLNQKIKDEIDNYSKEFSKTLFTGEDEIDEVEEDEEDEEDKDTELED